MAIENQFCPNCNKDDLQLDETTINTRLCLNCGYTTNSLYTIDSDSVKQFEQKSAKIIIELRLKDKKLNQYWYPSVINIYKKGLVFPEGKSKSDWKWAYSSYVPIPVQERINYPMPDKKGQFYEYKMDTESIVYYEKDEFKLAIKNLFE